MRFQKFSAGDTLGASQRVGATPSRTQQPARPLVVRGAQASRCWDPNLGPPQLFSRGCTPDYYYRET